MSTWYYMKFGERRGPASDAAMHEMVARGEISRDDLVWKEGMTDWQRADVVGEFMFPPTTALPPPPIGNRGAQTGGQTSGKAIASLICSVVGVTMCPLVGSIGGLVLGYGARTEIRESDGRLSGAELASAGIVVGWIGLFITIIPILIYVALIATYPPH